MLKQWIHFSYILYQLLFHKSTIRDMKPLTIWYFVTMYFCTIFFILLIITNNICLLLFMNYISITL